MPQNIDMEDKIIGPLTLLQFVYLIAGGVIIYILLNTVNTTIFWILAIPIGFLSIALAFIKIQDQPFSRFLGATVLYFVRPQRRVWQKETILETVPYPQSKAKKPEKAAEAPRKAVEKSELEKLSYILDTRGKVPEEQNLKTKN